MTNDDREIDGLMPFVDAMEAHAGICRRTAYSLLKTGKVAAVKIGSRTLIRRSELLRFLASVQAYEKVAA